MNESLTLAKYIYETNYDDIPENVREVSNKSFLDCLGVIIAASSLGDACRPFIKLALEEQGKKESTILGHKIKVPVLMASFANGSMAHAMDYEDAHDSGGSHPSEATVPAALAVAEYLGNVKGKELITAITLANDVSSRIALAINKRKKDPLEFGWYMAGIVGSFGAVTAASKLLHMNPEQIIDAFSLALHTTCSSELMNSPRSVVRAIRGAFTAKGGVLAALLAREGVKGFDQPLEGKFGFYTMYTGGNYDRTILTNNLGDVFEGSNVSFKPWPSCRGTHPFIDITLDIVKRYNVNPETIKKIKFVVGPNSSFKGRLEPLERKQHPLTAIDAKFSIPFTVTSALINKNVSLGSFRPQAIQDSTVLELAKKTINEIDNKLEPKQGLIQITTPDDEIIMETKEFTYGHPNNPMSEEAFLAKFRDCCSYSAKKMSGGNVEKLIQLILHLEDVDTVKEIIECL